jgi:hypothetical protein
MKAFMLFAVTGLIALSACTGPPGPPGPPGPAGSGGGPPYTWVCMAAHRPNTIGSQRLDVYVFNGGSVAANVAVNILDSSGNNLQGVTIPGAGPATYPGDAGATTVALAAGHTRDVFWTMPTTGGPGFDGVTNVSFSVRVTSDQPIVVGANFTAGGFLESKCGLLPK